MKSKIQGLGRIGKEFSRHGSRRLFQLERPGNFFSAFRNFEVTSTKVTLNLQTVRLLSNGVDGQLLARQQSS